MNRFRVGVAGTRESAEELLGVHFIAILDHTPERWDAATVIPIPKDGAFVLRRDGILIVSGGQPAEVLNALASNPDPVAIVISRQPVKGQVATALAARQAGEAIVVDPKSGPQEVLAINEPDIVGIMRVRVEEQVKPASAQPIKSDSIT